MFPWFDFLRLILQTIAAVFLEPMFWVMMLLIGYQYKRQQKEHLRMFGVTVHSFWQQLAAAAALGVVGGVVGSMILGFTGVTINKLGLQYIWPTAIALTMINLRFMCFAYAGGLVALVSAITGWPGVSVPQVVALVAGLHITESVLIAISGRFGASPLFLRREDGRVVGAFGLQNFWPLPLVVLLAVSQAEISPDSIPTPDWWPFLKSGVVPAAGETLEYWMLPVVAALGYADVAVASTPARRRLFSALHLAMYSIALMGLALLSEQYPWLQPLAALASPFGHELLIQLDKRKELRGTPRFVPPAEGMMVLDTVFDSPARRMGIRPGDIVLELGGLPTNNGYELARAIAYAPEEFTVTVRRDGMRQLINGRFADGERRLGLIPVPEGYEMNAAHEC